MEGILPGRRRYVPDRHFDEARLDHLTEALRSAAWSFSSGIPDRSNPVDRLERTVPAYFRGSAV